MKTIIANWKMNLGVRESVSLARASLLLLRGRRVAPQVIICPSYIALSEVRKVLARSSVMLGAQNVSWEEQGAFTGEISVRMLNEVGATHVLVGHSERRRLFHETDEMINQKVLKILEHNLVPIICMGETQEERDRGETRTRVADQLTRACAHVRLKASDRLIVAYEPVWAIGSGSTPSAAEVVEIHTHIREVLSQMFLSVSQDQIAVLYGGSVDGKDAYTFLREPMVDGVLVGGASIKLHQFTEIVEAASQVLEALSSEL